jgi:hypothetical protein
VIEPLRLSYELKCPASHAFMVWTTRIGTWWPKGHSASGDPTSEVFLEPGVGGRIFERPTVGAEIDWGVVTEWDPPGRLCYTWHIGRDSTQATEVALTFVELDGHTSRLDIVQTGWDRLGADGPSWREANSGGWGALIPAFLAAADAHSHS